MTSTATPSRTDPPRTPARPTRGQARPSLTDQLDRQRGFRRRVRRGVVVVLVLALVVTAAWLVYFSRVLDTRTVTVSGLRDLSADQVSRAAAVPLELPLARQDPDAIARRVTRLPQVLQVRVTRDWPHTVHVDVTEREPLLGVSQPGGWLVVDKAGVGFAMKSTMPSTVIRADADPDNRPLLVELGAVALALPADVRADVRSISAASRDAITLQLDSGVTVRWGDQSETPLKAQVVTALLAQHPKTSIDVSSPHNPAVK